MEDNSLIQKNPFGFNITLPKRTIQEVKKVVQQEIENIAVNPVNDFLESADSVFSGQTAKEIRKYQAQIYSLGQIMREGQARSTFNVKI